jgi:hypothetical protein
VQENAFLGKLKNIDFGYILRVGGYFMDADSANVEKLLLWLLKPLIGVRHV